MRERVPLTLGEKVKSERIGSENRFNCCKVKINVIHSEAYFRFVFYMLKNTNYVKIIIATVVKVSKNAQMIKLHIQIL